MIGFLKRIFFIDILKGLALTFRYTYSPVYTEQYPKEKARLAERYKGAPRLNNDPETGETLCIASLVLKIYRSMAPGPIPEEYHPGHF